MKKLNNFLYFDFEEFIKDKRLMTIGQQPWKDFTTGNVIGTKVEVVIASDKTNYQNKEGEVVNNLYEKLIIKVPSNVDIAMNTEIIPINAIATVYGDYRNQLSIVAEEIKIVVKK